MRYVQIKTPDDAVAHAVESISSRLQAGKNVAWFLSAGSAIDLAVRIAHKLQEVDSSRLNICLIDERFGPPGHADENHQQFMNAGFPFPIPRLLTGDSIEQVTDSFSTLVDRILDDADFVFGIFGIGADGHTAGIKPHSPCLTSANTATHYQWDDYERITITPSTIRRFNEVAAYARGREKADTLALLLHENASVEEQPAQLLKSVPLITLYTDNLL